MWILQFDFSRAQVRVPKDQYFAPPYYTPNDLARLGRLLFGMVPGIGRYVVLTWDAVAALGPGGIPSGHDTLLLVHGGSIPEKDAVEQWSQKECLEQAAKTGAHWAVVHRKSVNPSRSAWLERHVKFHLVSLARRWAHDENNPLARLNVRFLPVLKAAELTADPLELLALLEDTIAHRLRYTFGGTRVRERDWLHSLRWVAGTRLGVRLSGIEDPQARADAVTIILKHGEPPEDPVHFVRAAKALAQAGLADYVAGSLALGPLARHIRMPGFMGALEAALPPEAASLIDPAWWERTETLGLRRPTRRVRMWPRPILEWHISVGKEALSAQVEEHLAGVQVAREAFELWSDLLDTPPMLPLPDSAHTRRVGLLRRLDDARAPRAGHWQGQRLLKVLQGLLLAYGARGQRAIAEQAEGLAGIGRALKGIEEEAWAWRILGDVRLLCAAWLLEQARSAEDDRKAEELLTAVVGRAKQALEAGERSEIGVKSGDIAAWLLYAGTIQVGAEAARRRGDPEAFRKWLNVAHSALAKAAPVDSTPKALALASLEDAIDDAAQARKFFLKALELDAGETQTVDTKAPKAGTETKSETSKNGADPQNAGATTTQKLMDEQPAQMADSQHDEPALPPAQVEPKPARGGANVLNRVRAHLGLANLDIATDPTEAESHLRAAMALLDDEPHTLHQHTLRKEVLALLETITRPDAGAEAAGTDGYSVRLGKDELARLPESKNRTWDANELPAPFAPIGVPANAVAIAFNLNKKAWDAVQRGNLDEAETLHRTAIETAPRAQGILCDYATFLRVHRRDLEGAEAYYRQALAIWPSDWVTLNDFALFLWVERSDCDKAEQYFQRGLEVKPNTANALGNYALFLQWERRDPDGAEKYFQRALEVDPNDVFNLNVYAQFLATERREAEGAEEHYRRALKVAPDDADTLISYGLFLSLERGAHAKAEELLERALDVAPENANVLGGYATFLQEAHHDYQSAESYFRQALEANPESAYNQANYARLLFWQGRNAEGLDLVRQAESAVPVSAGERIELAFYRYAHDTNDRASALANLKALLERGARSPGWTLEPNVTQAKKQGHPEPEMLEAIAAVISKGAPLDSLEAFEAWREAEGEGEGRSQ